MKYCIIGGLGYVGNEVVRQLKEKNEQVIIVDNRFRVAPDISDISDVPVINADIRNFEEIADALNNIRPDIIINLAAIHYIPECNENPTLAFDVNVTGTLNILRAAEKVKPQHCIIVSSGAVYADTDEELDEINSIVCPQDIYGITKKVDEDICQLYASNNPGIKFSIVRLFNVYGPRETNAHIIPEIINQLRQSDKLVLGNIKTRRDMIFTSDVAKGFIKIAERNMGKQLEIINLSSGYHSSMEDLISLIKKVSGKPIVVEIDPKRFRKSDKMKQVGSNKKLVELTGFRPGVTLEKGVEMLLKYEQII